MPCIFSFGKAWSKDAISLPAGEGERKTKRKKAAA
jgi:hypothetical protein